MCTHTRAILSCQFEKNKRKKEVTVEVRASRTLEVERARANGPRTPNERLYEDAFVCMLWVRMRVYALNAFYTKKICEFHMCVEKVRENAPGNCTECVRALKSM